MTKSCTAVLVSGGLDSAVLLAEEASAGDLQPVYVSVGLAWEAAERSVLDRFLAAAPLPPMRPLASLAVDMTDVYPATHWARTGRPPAYHTPDEDVYLPGKLDRIDKYQVRVSFGDDLNAEIKVWVNPDADSKAAIEEYSKNRQAEPAPASNFERTA